MIIAKSSPIEEVVGSEIKPGEIIDGQFIGVPRYIRIRHLAYLAGMRKYMRHLAIDIGAKKARRQLARLNKTVQSLAKYVGVSGHHLVAHTGGLSTMPDAYTINRNCLSVTIWIVRVNQIVHELVIEAGNHGKGMWRHGDKDGWHTWSRADVTMRSMQGRKFV